MMRNINKMWIWMKINYYERSFFTIKCVNHNKTENNYCKGAKNWNGIKHVDNIL